MRRNYRLFVLCGLGLVYLGSGFRSMTALRDSTSGSKRIFLFIGGSGVQWLTFVISVSSIFQAKLVGSFCVGDIDSVNCSSVVASTFE